MKRLENKSVIITAAGQIIEEISCMDLSHVAHTKFYQNGFLIKYFVHQ